MAETTHKYLDDEEEERECGGEDGYCPECFNDEEEERECGGEDGYCPECFAKEAAYWGSYFGVASGAHKNFAPVSDHDMVRFQALKEGRES